VSTFSNSTRSGLAICGPALVRGGGVDIKGSNHGRGFEHCGRLRKSKGLARDMKNGVSAFGLSLQHLDCLSRVENNQFDLVTLGFTLYVLHDGQSAVSLLSGEKSLPRPKLLIRKVLSGAGAGNDLNSI